MERGGDTLGKLIGVLVFLLGIAVIVAAVVLAYELFLDPLVAMPANSLGPRATWQGLVAGFIGLIMRILLLLVVSISGAFLATRGIRMYEAARGNPSAPSSGE